MQIKSPSSSGLLALLLSQPVLGHANHGASDPIPLGPAQAPIWPPEDLDKDLPFSQPVTFAHLPWARCLAGDHAARRPLDVAVLGFPYDTSASYRPGARFGPRGIRTASAREKKGRAYNTKYAVDPFVELDEGRGWSVLDCGDIPITPFDAAHAFKQMEQGYRQILWHDTTPTFQQKHNIAPARPPAPNPWTHPRILALGGDHSIVLPILRSLAPVYGPISVIHLDSHLDTWDPYAGYTGIASDQSAITHGTFFWHAGREGCIARNASVHAGLRTKLFGPDDYRVDREDVGFHIIEADEIDGPEGVDGVVRRVKEVVGLENPVYLSIDIDVLDPSIAPATGTPESGGWTTRELRRFIKGLEGLRLVGADVVEVSPPYDTAAEITSIAASDLLVDILAVMVNDKWSAERAGRDGHVPGKDEL